MASRFTRRHVTVTFEDNVGTTLTVGPGPGDFTVSGLEEGNREALETRDRHAHDGWVYGDDVTQEWSITVEQVNQSLTSAAAARIYDWIVNKTRAGAALTSVDPTVWAFKVRVSFNDGAATASILLPNNRAKCDSLAEAKETNTFKISGINVAAPTVT